MAPVQQLSGSPSHDLIFSLCTTKGLNGLALDHCNGTQLDDFVGDAGCVAGVHHRGDVLVRLGRLLHDELRRGDPDGDAFLCQRIEHLLVA